MEQKLLNLIAWNLVGTPYAPFTIVNVTELGMNQLGWYQN